ncbi:MAG: hypothetical protein IJQ07_06410 [Clostridia bacterium]|nr:hypothetical protein [Clostridia bacterium]
MQKSDRVKLSLGQVSLIFYTMVYIIISILPMLKYSVPYAVAGSFSLLYALFVFIKYEKYRLSIMFLVFLGVITGLLLFLNGTQTVTGLINEPIRVLRCIIPCFILADVIKTNKNFKIFLWIFLTALILYIAINTLAELAQNSMAARLLASGDTSEELTQYRMRNIAGFEFSYAIGLSFPVWVILFSKSKNIFLKILSLVLAAFVAYYVVAAQYMILFLMCIVSLFVVILTGSGKFYVKLINVLIILVLLLFASTIFRWAASLDIGEMMQRRFTSLADLFEGKIDIEDTTSRIGLYKNALNAFLSSPIIGVYNSSAAFESHSWLLGFAVSAGIIGVACFVAELVIYSRLHKKVFIDNRLSMRVRIITYTLFVVLTVLNAIQYSYEIFIVLFLYIPLTLNLFYKRDGAQLKGEVV